MTFVSCEYYTRPTIAVYKASATTIGVFDGL